MMRLMTSDIGTLTPAAADQSPELAGQIMAAAQTAFTDAYNVVGLLGGVALLATAVVARRVFATPDTPETDLEGTVETSLQPSAA